MAEEWKDVPGYEGLYQVSNHGRVRSLDRSVRGGLKNGGKISRTRMGKLLLLYKNELGTKKLSDCHLSCYLCDDGNRRKFFAHRLVMLAFVGPCPEGMEVCHNDGNPQNNRLDNLRYDTPLGNSADQLLHGTRRSKLTEDVVRDIRLRHANGETGRGIASDVGICEAHVSNICNGKVWRHLV